MIQIFYILLSYLFVKYILKWSVDTLGYVLCDSMSILTVIILSLVISVIIALVELSVASSSKLIAPVPGLFQNPSLYVMLAFIIAPIGEETLFRGLLLGGLIKVGVNTKISVIMQAILFSIIHIIPFKNAPIIQLIVILITAFILSVIAGIYRVRTYSIIPAIVTHICFNLGGILTSFII